MQDLIELYIQALKDHRVDYWNDIRELIYKQLVDVRYIIQ